MLPTGRGGEALADLSEFTVTSISYLIEQISLSDWLHNTYGPDAILWPSMESDTTIKTISIQAKKPAGYDVYYTTWGQPWTVIWML